MANEKRLIDADALVKLMCRACNNECCEEPCEPGECFMYDAISNAPTVDAVPVVHGRWVEDTATDMIACTECGHAWSTIDNCTETFNYCPNCGAYMREGRIKNEKDSYIVCERIC